MGWLDNSTNNIILDAVLTDFGRESLARNNGSFNIVKFSLGDDEVNYQIIKKYGRTIGREKLEKNTPVFEALTNQNLALKYKLISIPAPIVYLPNLSLVSQDASVVLNKGNSKTVTVSQALADNDSAIELDPSIADSNFDLYYPSLFLRIGNLNNVPGQVSQDALRTAHTVLSSTTVSNTERNVSFNLYAVSIPQSTFSTYGRLNTSSIYEISTTIKLVGQSSGAELTIPVTIKNQTS